MKNILKKMFGITNKPTLQRQVPVVSSPKKEKETAELDFWINVWNKKIIDDVVKKHGLNNSNDSKFDLFYKEERKIIARNQLSGLLWMAKKPEGYLDGKVVIEIGPGCCCGLDVSKASMKILVEPIAEAYRDNNLLIDNGQSALYLTCGSEKIPLFGDYADVVIASNSLDHVEDINASVAELWRVLKPKGELFLNIEINHEPTVCEPFAPKYDDVVALFKDGFQTVFIDQTTNPDGREWVRAVFKKTITSK